MQALETALRLLCAALFRRRDAFVVLLFECGAIHVLARDVVERRFCSLIYLLLVNDVVWAVAYFLSRILHPWCKEGVH